MKLLRAFAIALLLGTGIVRGAAPLPVEQTVSDLIKSPNLTIVHFWAPWCSNCAHELANDGWSNFIKANPKVNVVFVTVWSDKDGMDVLAKNHVGDEPNFKVLLYPNPSRKKGERFSGFLGMDVPWIPTTWIYKDGKLFYSLQYGEMHFNLLQQLVDDSSKTW